MKKVTVKLLQSCLLLLMLGVTGCSKGKDNDLGPGGDVPADLTGQWLHGTFAMATYWGYDGSYQGNPSELSVAFDFKASGHFEMFLIIMNNDYGCRTEALTSLKGKVDFNETAKTFTITPVEGNYRGYYSCASGRNFNRKATATELQEQKKTYSYEFTEDGKWLMINGSSFKATRW